MALHQHRDSEPSVLDRWIAEQGENGIEATAERLKRGVADGTVPVFADRETFLAYYRQRPRQA